MRQDLSCLGMMQNLRRMWRKYTIDFFGNIQCVKKYYILPNIVPAPRICRHHCDVVEVVMKLVVCEGASAPQKKIRGEKRLKVTISDRGKRSSAACSAAFFVVFSRAPNILATFTVRNGIRSVRPRNHEF